MIVNFICDFRYFQVQVHSNTDKKLKGLFDFRKKGEEFEFEFTIARIFFFFLQLGRYSALVKKKSIYFDGLSKSSTTGRWIFLSEKVSQYINNFL